MNVAQLISAHKFAVNGQAAVATVSEETGRMPNGADVNYLILTVGEKELKVHPRRFSALVKKGADGVITVEAIAPVADQADAAPVVTIADANTGAATDDGAAAPESATKSPSKRDICTSCFKRGGQRKDVINAMVTESGLSKAGAATYYQNFKSGKWAV